MCTIAMEFPGIVHKDIVVVVVVVVVSSGLGDCSPVIERTG
jgi:hypothetical protein